MGKAESNGESQMAEQGDLLSDQGAAFLQAVLDALSAQIAILDEQGIIGAVNAPWRRFADENGLAWTDYGIGRSYLAAFEGAVGDEAEDARAAAGGIRAVMSGSLPVFRYEYPCDSPDEKRWFMMWATPVSFHANRGVVIAHENITVRKLAEIEATSARLEAEEARAA